MSESSIKPVLGHYLSKLKSFFFTKDVLSFLLFLIISFGFWFVNMLDKERETEIVIPLRYSGMPQQFDITHSNVNVLRLIIKDKGLNLFAYSGSKLKALTVDLSRNFNERGNVVINNDVLRSRLMKYLLPSTSILEIKPDSLVLTYERLEMKQLPVVLYGKIETAQQYILSDEVNIKPAMVTVYGPKELLSQLNEIKTVEQNITNLDQNISKTVKLQRIRDLRFSTNEVLVTANTEMFTEKELYFPVVVMNCPAELYVRTFPTQVKLTFNVGLSHFKTVKVDDVLVYIDYAEILKNNSGKQRINVVNKVSYISNIRAEKEEVEYIIERNKKI